MRVGHRLAVTLFAIGSIAIGWLAGSGSAHAGAVIHQTVKDLPDGKVKDDETVYVQDGMIRAEKLDDRGAPTTVSIFREDAMWVVNVPQRTYRKLDKQAGQQAAQRMQAMREQMQAQLANLPPERRAAVERAMAGAGAAPEVTWSATGRTDHVAGLACEIWEGRKQDKLEYEYCIARPGDVPDGPEIYAALQKMEAALKEALSGMQGVTGAGGMGNVYGSLSWTERAKGYPILRRNFSGGKPYQEHAVSRIEAQKLPADKFAIPEGFREVSSMGGKRNEE